METRQPEQLQAQIRTDLRPGDIGYLTYLHGVLYAREYGWDYTFDGYVAESLARFVLSYDPGKDRLWLVEIDGRIVGSIGIAGHVDAQAQLRWFLVHPASRGRGLGRTLLVEALRFCRERKFLSVFLWTVSDLKAATHLYRLYGFEKTEEKTHPLWGTVITEERYELTL
jgi:ribosomal protein S18 acetylase RimI-like enzyme